MIQKHMLHISKYLVFAVIISSILLTNFALLATSHDAVFLLDYINMFKYRWYFLWFKLGLNLLMILHFVWSFLKRNSVLSRERMIDSDRYDLGFQILGTIVYFKKYLVFPLHIIAFFRMLSCQGQDAEDP